MPEAGSSREACSTLPAESWTSWYPCGSRCEDSLVSESCPKSSSGEQGLGVGAVWRGGLGVLEFSSLRGVGAEKRLARPSGMSLALSAVVLGFARLVSGGSWTAGDVSAASLSAEESCLYVRHLLFAVTPSYSFVEGSHGGSAA